MGGKAIDLSPEDELGQLIAGASGQDESTPEEELASLLASAPAQTQAPKTQGGGTAPFVEPDPGGENAQAVDNMMARDPEYVRMLDEQAASPAMQAERAHQQRMASDPSYALKQLVKLGSNYATGALGALGSEAGLIKNAATQGIAAGSNRFVHDKLDDVGTLDALVNAGKDGLYAGGAALGLGSIAAGAGAGRNRAVPAAFNASKSDLQELGETPASFTQRTDELGLNNDVIPMDVADKRARIQAALADRGAQHNASIAAADASNPLAGRDVNGEIARDIEQNADRVWTGRSNQREPIVNAMGKTANAVEQGDPIDTLAELGRYRTQQGGQAFGKFGSLPDAASGQGALAAYDSADQKLHDAMAASGDKNYQLFTSSDNDFHDLKLLEELTNQAPPSNPVRRAIGAGVGAAVGGMVGGGVGAPIGAAVTDMTRGYQADAAANMLGGVQRNMSMASGMTGAATAASDQLQQVRNQSRGQDMPDVVESMLQNPPPWMQQYASLLAKAQQDGKLNEALTKLRNTDDNWRTNVLPQLQMMTAQGAQ